MYVSGTESVGPCLCHDPLQVRLEQERVAALVAGRRQREATLVGKFDSDEIYNLEDENGLAMRQARRESRCRVRALCEGRKLADTIDLITDDLIRELQTFLTRCVRSPSYGSTTQNTSIGDIEQLGTRYTIHTCWFFTVADKYHVLQSIYVRVVLHVML